MKIVVVSDSHGKVDVLRQILDTHPDADAFFHCGDIELPSDYFPEFITVCGNNDYYGGLSYEKIVNVQGHRFLLTHSHQYLSMNRNKDMRKKAKRLHCDMVCYGHTHCYHESLEDGVYLLNPGSCAYPRDGRVPSYAVIRDGIDGVLTVERIFLEF